MFGGPGGGFLNLGTPEMIVIGAVAWALLGPKELYRLANEAGKFLGEWQQLGQQAKNTFTDALDAEMREDEFKKSREALDKLQSQFGEDGTTPAATEQPFAPVTNMESSAAAEPAAPAAAPSWYEDGIPSLDEYQETRRKAMEEAPPLTGLASEDPLPPGTFVSEPFATAEEAAAAGEEALQARTVDEQSTFLQQISGDTNRRVLEEYPPELNVEEDLIATRIAQAENELEMLKTEAKVLELRREQQETNAVRAAKEKERDALMANGAQEGEAAEA